MDIIINNEDPSLMVQLPGEAALDAENTCDDEDHWDKCQKEFKKFFHGNTNAQHACDIIINTTHSLVVTGYDNAELLKFIELAQTLMYNALPVAVTKAGAQLIKGGTVYSKLRVPIEFTLPDDVELSKIFFSEYEYYEWILGRQFLIISEISMVTAAMLDCINVILQKVANNKELFGGMRILFIGDPFQLTAIVDKKDRPKLLKHYPSEHFSESKAFKQLNPIMIEIKSDSLPLPDSLQSCLEKIRKHKDISAVIEILNTRYFESRTHIRDIEHDPAVIICFNRYDASEINAVRFDTLKTDILYFDAEETGKFEWGKLKVRKRLELREGTRVMLTKSHKDGAYPFGTLGYLTTITSEIVVFTPDHGEAFEVVPEKWYTSERISKQEGKRWITEYVVVGTMTQYPLVYAWAISVYKSQGQTFENVHVYGPGYWVEPMHRYAALSRARSLEGLTLHRELVKKAFKRNKNASQFSTAVKREKRVKQILKDIHNEIKSAEREGL